MFQKEKLSQQVRSLEDIYEVNDTEIDITKFLKSPDPQAENMNKDIIKTFHKDELEKSVKMKKVFESSIDFVSDGDESDFDEKLIQT